MNNKEKHRYAFRLTSVASTGLSFIENSLFEMMRNGTDLAFLRPFYILLSYNFELILKSRVVMLSNFPDKNSLIGELIKLGHDLVKIREALAANLQELGIKEITDNGTQYEVVTTNNEKIYIENFTKIRYDFLDGVMRNVDAQEHARIKKYAGVLVSILRKVKQKNEETKNLP